MTVAAFAARKTLVGLEHEFVVSSAAGVVDFRTVIHGLELGQPNLDPCAPYAYRLPSGAVVTCDAAEAEIALPPTRVGPGFAFEVARRAGVERLALIGRVPAEIHLEGYSTHLSVSVSDLFTKAVCQAYAKRFAPAMMLFGDRRDSPGLLVRPRPGRVELGVEYLASDQLVAASIFAVASVLTCLRAVSSASDDDLPAELDVRIDPAVQRFGSYVDRRAFGGDLLTDGRAAELRGVDGGDVVTAQRHLEQCWRVARATIELLASAEELALVDAAVRGERPLPSERAVDDPVPTSEDPTLSLGPVYGAALATRERGSFDVAPVMLTWELAVLLILGRRRTRRRAFAAVPGTGLGSFLAALDSGALDEEVERYLDLPHRTRQLRSWTEISGPALFDAIGPRIELLQPELGYDGELTAHPSGAPRTSLSDRLLRPWGRTPPPRWLGVPGEAA